jgi:DNA-binding winged helix-turn-helix (wHTH) protein
MPAENPHFITSPENLEPRARQLFAFLVREPNRVFTKEEIIAGCPRLAPVRHLDSIALRLRSALEAFDGRRSPVNVWGVGYRLQDAPVAPAPAVHGPELPAEGLRLYATYAGTLADVSVVVTGFARSPLSGAVMARIRDTFDRDDSAGHLEPLARIEFDR